MNFRDSRQRSRLCLAVLRMGKLDRYWRSSDLGDSGPTDEAWTELHLAHKGGSLLSTGEKTLLQVVFDLWDGSGRASLWDMMNNLDTGVCQSIGELLMALADEDPRVADEWEKTWAGYDPAKEFSAG